MDWTITKSKGLKLVDFQNTTACCSNDIGIETSFVHVRITKKVAVRAIARRQGSTQCPHQCSGLYQIKRLPFAANADLHDHLATNLSCVRLIRFRLFVAQQRNGFANLPRNVAASTTPKPRADICISPSSLRNSTLSPQHSFNYCFRWIFTRSVLKASFPHGLLLTRNSVQPHELDF
jgi:hypothetical protein